MDAKLPIVVIADDDEFFRMALGTILTKQLGFAQVIEAASLDEALEQLGRHPQTSVALFDLAMPGVQSPANLKAVRERFPHTRVVVVSASSSRHDILAALEAGVHGYVPKCLGVVELAAALRTILEGTIYVPPSLTDMPLPTNGTDAGHPDPVTGSKRGPNGSLTTRQKQVLDLVIQGQSNKEIALSLRLGEGTVKVHMAALFRFMNVKTRAAAAVAGGKFLPPRRETGPDDPSKTK